MVFPGMPVTLPVDVGSDSRVLLCPGGQRYAKVGVVAEVSERVAAGRARRRLADGAPPGRPRRGPHRSRRHPSRGGRRPSGRDAAADPDARSRARVSRGGGGDSRTSRRRRPDQRVRPLHHRPGPLADTAGYSPDLNVDQKLELLETLDVVERLTLALRFQQERLAELRVRKRIRDDVESGAQKQQREYFLRRQMDAIRKELGENEASVAEEYRKKIAAAAMPEPVRQAERELARFERMGDSSARRP